MEDKNYEKILYAIYEMLEKMDNKLYHIKEEVENIKRRM